MKNKLLKTVCAWMGHSFQVVETCFGYIHCGRCGEQIGDALGGVYDTKARQDIKRSRGEIMTTTISACKEGL